MATAVASYAALRPGHLCCVHSRQVSKPVLLPKNIPDRDFAGLIMQPSVSVTPKVISSTPEKLKKRSLLRDRPIVYLARIDMS